VAELHEVDAWLAALLSQLEPAARKKMLREVARDVRRIQQANITAQRSPDGTAWEPRRVTARTKPGRIRRKMFLKLKTIKYLKIRTNDNQAEVSFATSAQKIANVHHYGLREPLKGRKIVVKYPERRLIGFNINSEDVLHQMIIKSLKF